MTKVNVGRGSQVTGRRPSSIKVSEDGVFRGTQPEINFTGNVDVSNDPTNNRFNVNVTGGGGGVQSVTGNVVDNTDPENPVVTAQPNLGFAPSRRILYKRNASTSVTGSTAEQLCDSFLIPAGTIGANDILFIEAVWTKSGAVSNCTIRNRIGDNNDLTGTVFGVNTTAGATEIYKAYQRIIVFKNSVASQEVFPAGVSAINHLGASTTAISSLAVNFATDKYFVVSFAGDSSTITLRSLLVEIIRS